ncbi:MAG: SMI1/KNR4 family protein, partial [Planctomycetota bacterium]|nr:SMI1/KNR4 family protein [Planctomycetota bacterium]
GQLIERRVGVVAVPSRGVLPLPRRSMISSVALIGSEFQMESAGQRIIVNIRDFLHAHVGRMRVRGSRRILTRGGRELRVETEITLIDLYFRGGAAYRLDLNKVSFEHDPNLSGLVRAEATTNFLWELAQKAQDVRRPIVPAALPLVEGPKSPYWAAARIPSLVVFDNWGRWWFALAANQHLPSPARLDEIVFTNTPARKSPPSTALMPSLTPSSGTRLPNMNTPARGTPTSQRPPQNPALTPSQGTKIPRPPGTGRYANLASRQSDLQYGDSEIVTSSGASDSLAPVNVQVGQRYEQLMNEAADFENQGYIEQAEAKYREALETQDTFEVRLALVETLVDSNPFEAWHLCGGTVDLYAERAAELVESYKGVHRENYDCHDFLTYRALRRFLRKLEVEKQPNYDPMRKFFSFHELSNKLPDTTKGGLLDAYGEELHFVFPTIHRQLISSYNGLDLFNRAFRFLGVGGEDEAFDLLLFNDPYGWRRFYGPSLSGLIGFGYDYLGNVFLYDPRERPNDPSIVRLDADTGELEPVSGNFVEFIGVDLTDRDEDIARSRLLRQWQTKKSQLKMHECLSFQTSPVLGGERNFLNLTTSELGIRLHMAGQIATQAQQIPEGATIHGVRVVNQEELLLKVYWDY